jgi:hypothetical protein
MNSNSEFYSIEIDPSRTFVRVQLRNHWSDDLYYQFEVALRQAVERMAARGVTVGTFRTLVDLQNQGVLPKQQAEILARLATSFGPVSAKVALVVASALHKLQLTRITPQDRFRVFLDAEEATAWVLSD